MRRHRLLPLLLPLVGACSGPAHKPTSINDGPGLPTVQPSTLTTLAWDAPAGDVQIHLRAVGGREGGATLIAVHGGPGLSHEYTEPLEHLASADRRVVTYDQRGTGRSSEPADATAHGLAQHVADLEAVRVALGDEQVDLLGHSWGGLVIMAYAVAHPEHVRRLIFVDSIPPTYEGWVTANERFDERVTALEEAKIIATDRPGVDGDDCGPRLLAILPVYYADPHHPATKDLGGTHCYAHLNPATWRAVGRYDLAAPLAAVVAPALIVQGDADPFGPMSAPIDAALTGSKHTAVTFPACGHIPWEECPEPFYREVEAFLAAP